MNDLPKILRGMADMLDGPQNAGNFVVPAIIGRFRDAADTIESLETENAVLRAQQEQPNEPLTLDELQEMDGEPVWVEFVGRPDGSPIPPLWMRVNVSGKQIVTDVEYVDWSDEGWLAYRIKHETEGVH